MAGKRSGKKIVTKSATKKDRKQKEQLMKGIRENNKRSEDLAHKTNLEELMEWLEGHPEATSAMLCQVRAGSWDSGSESEEEERVPAYQNKINVLSKENIFKIVSSFSKDLCGWLQGLPKKTQKGELGAVLAFLTHMEPTSALPTKALGALQKYLGERWDRHGRRGEAWLKEKADEGDETPCLEDTGY